MRLLAYEGGLGAVVGVRRLLFGFVISGGSEGGFTKVDDGSFSVRGIDGGDAH
jgi:hypothetical protein